MTDEERLEEVRLLSLEKTEAGFDQSQPLNTLRMVVKRMETLFSGVQGMGHSTGDTWGGGICPTPSEIGPHRPGSGGAE